MDDYESVICVKPEVLVFKIGPRPSNRGFRAADWKLDQPDWKGRMRIVSRNNKVFIKLEDKTTGELFAQSPVESYPGLAVESVLDSSRYFVIKIEDESGRHAFIGMGFQDRGDAFDFNVSLQDHFNYIKKEQKLQEEATHPEQVPKLDLGFKDGQTIRINIGNNRDECVPSKPKAKVGGPIGILPPPPGGSAPRLAPPPGSSGSRSPVMHQANPIAAPAPAPAPTQGNQFLLGGLPAPSTQQTATSTNNTTDWGDFASAGSGNSSGGNWVQF